MRYRQLDPVGDMQFGQGRRNYYVDQPEAVAQAILTRLRLEVGEWYLDVTEGTPYQTRILGYGSQDSRDLALRNRVLGTQGILEIVSYSSSVVDRRLSVAITVNTAYGELLVKLNQGVTPSPDVDGVMDWSIAGNVLLMVVN